MKEAKEQLILKVSGAASWRFEKQERYRTDPWNTHAAESLQALEVHLQSLPEDHPIFSWYWNWITDETAMESFDAEIRAYGYQNANEESEEFIARLLKGSIDELEEE